MPDDPLERLVQALLTLADQIAAEVREARQNSVDIEQYVISATSMVSILRQLASLLHKSEYKDD